MLYLFKRSKLGDKCIYQLHLPTVNMSAYLSSEQTSCAVNQDNLITCTFVLMFSEIERKTPTQYLKNTH